MYISLLPVYIKPEIPMLGEPPLPMQPNEIPWWWLSEAIHEIVGDSACAYIWQGCHSLGRSEKEAKNHSTKENGHNFGMIKDVFIKVFTTSF